jgi:hypothetical protein
VANRSFAGSATPADASRSQPGSEQCRRCSSSETTPSTRSSPPRDFSTPLRGAQPEAIDAHYHAIRVAMRGVFYELGIAAWPSTNLPDFAPKRAE